MRYLQLLLFVQIFIIYNNQCLAQTYKQVLCDIFSSTQEPSSTSGGVFSFLQSYSPSGSKWEIDWDESVVFNKLLKYEIATNSYQSFELRMGKGGQVYSFKSKGFGEALPPQWRASYNENGQVITDQGPSNPINSHHGNWAPWVDEVWQLVGSDQKDSLNNLPSTKNIHQAGSYMNNYAHRASDHTVTPFYSPMIQSFYDSTTQSYTTIHWGQSESPAFVYDSTTECDVCFNPAFRPSLLYFLRYKNKGNGVIQVDFLVYNFHRERGIDYFNFPFIGIRNSSLPFAFISNSSVNDSTYDILNSKIGHPDVQSPSSYLPTWTQGITRVTSGTKSQSSGWFAFSTDPLGHGPSLAFVTAKQSSNPKNAFGDIRYGTAMSNSIRDITIFSRRANGGAVDPKTGMKQWGIVGGQSIKGRYFIVLDSSLINIIETIKNRDLVNYASLEKTSIAETNGKRLHYTFKPNTLGQYAAIETDSTNAYISLNSLPFTGSFPVFIISSDAESFISSDPYALSLKPYDNTMQAIELLGFTSTHYKTQKLNIILSTADLTSKSMYIYPTLATSTLHIESIEQESAQTMEISIINQTGQVVMQQSLDRSPRQTIDVSQLQAGLYLVRINDGSHFYIKKFVKQ